MIAALQPPDLSGLASLGATVASVSALALVLSTAGPKLRNFREIQRLWTATGNAAKDGKRQATAVQESLDRIRTSETLKSLKVNTAVHELRVLRGQFKGFMDDLDGCLKSMETVRQRLSALKKHAGVIRLAVADFDTQMREFETTIAAAMPEFVAVSEQLHSGVFLDQLDDVIRHAIDAATEHAVQRSKEIALAKTKPPSVDEVLGSLDTIGAYAHARGIKLAGG